MKSDVHVSFEPSAGSPPQATPFVSPFKEGEIVAGKYRVTGLVGTGGIGFVVSAVHLDLGEPVALKFLRPEFVKHPEALRRFGNEARSAAKIKSEHAVRVFDVGHLADGAPFIVMELLEGKDLGEVLRKEGAQPIEVAVEYALQACEALATAHASSVIHRDVKPDNLFLAKRPQGTDLIKVLDFGISKIAISDPSLGKQTTMAVGSPHYMSPEQVRAADTVDARADIWSLGCVLYELLTGTPAFDGPSLMQISAAILESTPRKMRSIYPYLPEELEAVVERCLEKDPDRRFQDVASLASALVPFASARAQIWAERCSHMSLLPAEPSAATTQPSPAVLLSPAKLLDTQPASTSAVSFTRAEGRPAGGVSKSLLVAVLLVVIGATGYALRTDPTATVKASDEKRVAAAEPALGVPRAVGAADPAPSDAEPAGSAPGTESLPASQVAAQAAALAAAPDGKSQKVVSAPANPRRTASSARPRWRPYVVRPATPAPKPLGSSKPQSVIDDELDVGF